MTIDIMWHDGKVTRLTGAYEVLTFGGAAILRVTTKDGSVLHAPLWHVKTWRTWP